MTTQDLVKGIDLTALAVVSGSEVNQQIDVGRLAADKGMIIETTDTALDTPVVPDPNNNYAGIIPSWWKRYIWKRNVWGGTIKHYGWNEAMISNPPLLKWWDFDYNALLAQTVAAAAAANAATAIATANNAISVANTANATAINSLTVSNQALTLLDALTIRVISLESATASIWASGDFKLTGSTITPAGWLECNGQAIDRTTYAPLFAAIGTTWGNGDGVTTFNVPDFRGRTLIGAGMGAGLTNRVLGIQNIGAETHTLSGLESGIQTHSHEEVSGSAGTEAIGGGGADRITFGTSGAPGGTNVGFNTAAVANTNAALAHPNMQPSAVARILIKA